MWDLGCGVGLQQRGIDARMSARSKSKKIFLTSVASANSDGCGPSVMTVSCTHSVTATASPLVGVSGACGAAAALAAIGAGAAGEESSGVRAPGSGGGEDERTDRCRSQRSQRGPSPCRGWCCYTLALGPGATDSRCRLFRKNVTALLARNRAGSHHLSRTYRGRTGESGMNDAVRLPAEEIPVGPITILDGQGRVLRVVAAAEFRRHHPVEAGPARAGRTGRRPPRCAPSARPS